MCLPDVTPPLFYSIPCSPAASVCPFSPRTKREKGPTNRHAGHERSWSAHARCIDARDEGRSKSHRDPCRDLAAIEIVGLGGSYARVLFLKNLDPMAATPSRTDRSPTKGRGDELLGTHRCLFFFSSTAFCPRPRLYHCSCSMRLLSDPKGPVAENDTKTEISAAAVCTTKSARPHGWCGKKRGYVATRLAAVRPFSAAGSGHWLKRNSRRPFGESHSFSSPALCPSRKPSAETKKKERQEKR